MREVMRGLATVATWVLSVTDIVLHGNSWWTLGWAFMAVFCTVTLWGSVRPEATDQNGEENGEPPNRGKGPAGA